MLISFDILAGLASIVGLILTVLTLRVASSARDAAREAKEAALRSTAATDLDALTRLAAEFLDKVQSDRLSEAILRSRDLIGGIATARKRWHQFLDKDGRSALEEASVQIQIASRVLASRGETLEAKQKDRLCQIAGAILHSLGAEAGKITSDI